MAPASRDPLNRRDGRPAPASAAGAGMVQRLRARIDAGLTGEKVDHPDPAAAPLGTDEEAAGATPTPGEARLAARSAPGGPGSGALGSRRRSAGWPTALMAAVAAAAALVFLAALFVD